MKMEHRVLSCVCLVFAAVKTVVVKGKAPVDPECTTKVGTAHVYVEGKDIYDVMLNQVNLAENCSFILGLAAKCRAVDVSYSVTVVVVVVDGTSSTPPWSVAAQP